MGFNIIFVRLILVRVLYVGLARNITFAGGIPSCASLFRVVDSSILHLGLRLSQSLDALHEFILWTYAIWPFVPSLMTDFNEVHRNFFFYIPGLSLKLIPTSRIFYYPSCAQFFLCSKGPVWAPFGSVFLRCMEWRVILRTRLVPMGICRS